MHMYCDLLCISISREAHKGAAVYQTLLLTAMSHLHTEATHNYGSEQQQGVFQVTGFWLMFAYFSTFLFCVQQHACNQ